MCSYMRVFTVLFLQGQYEDCIEFETNVSFQEPDFVSVLTYEKLYRGDNPTISNEAF